LTLRVIKQYCRRNILPYKEFKPNFIYWREPSFSEIPADKLPPKYMPSQWLHLVNQDNFTPVSEYSAGEYSGGEKRTAEIQSLFEKATAHKKQSVFLREIITSGELT